MSLHPFSSAVETELREHNWVAHPRGEWDHLAGRANEYYRLRSTILDVADQFDRLARAGGQYAEIRRQHAILLRAAVENPQRTEVPQ